MSTNVVDIVDEFYRKADESIKGPLSKEPITCKKGCHGCCFQMIGISPAEAIHIISKLSARPGFRETLRKCLEEAKRVFTFKTMGEGFASAVPCVFLQNGLCGIYDIRPVVCRYYFVVSPPENCYPGSLVKGVFHLDSHQTAGEEMARRVTLPMLLESKDVFIPPFGPLPAMLVWAAFTLCTGGDKIWAKKMMDKLPSPTGWRKVFDKA